MFSKLLCRVLGHNYIADGTSWMPIYNIVRWTRCTRCQKTLFKPVMPSEYTEDERRLSQKNKVDPNSPRSASAGVFRMTIQDDE